MRGRFCQRLLDAQGYGVCRKKNCDGCELAEKKRIAESPKVKKGEEKRPRTVAFLRTKIAQKKAHIANEEARLEILEGLLEEQEET